MGYELVYESNGQKIGDGMRVTRVSQDGQRLEVLVDDKTERFSPIIAVLKEDVPDPVEPQPDPEPTPDPIPDPVPQPVPTPANVQNAGELAQALSSAIGGETFVLAPGDYGDCPSIPSGVTLQAADPAQMPKFSRMNVVNRSDITIRDLHLKYTYAAGDGDATNRFLCQDSTNIRYIGCLIEGDYSETGEGKGRGLRLWGNNRNCLIKGCEIAHWWKGIGLNGTDIVCRANDIHDIRSDGINTGDGSNYLIEGNYIHDFAMIGGQFDHRDMIQIIGAANGITIRDNLLDQGAGRYAQGIWSDANSKDFGVVIQNNVLIMSHTNCIAWINFDGGDWSGNRVAQWLDDQGNPRPDNNPGIAIPKINAGGDNFACMGNVAPGIINPKTYDPSNQIKVLDDKALRAEAQADPRWSHFFA